MVGKRNKAGIGAVVGGALGLALGAWLGDIFGGVLGGIMLGGLIGLVIQNGGRAGRVGVAQATAQTSHDPFPHHLGVGAMGLAAHQVHLNGHETDVRPAETACVAETAGNLGGGDFGGGGDCGPSDSGGGS